LSLHNYHDTYGCLPPGRTGTANGGSSNDTRLSAFVALLPHIEQDALYDTIMSANNQGGRPWGNGPDNAFNEDLDALLCPSDAYQDRDRGKCNYVVNHGDRATELEAWEAERNRGLFCGSAGGGGRWIPISFSAIIDGTSNTIAMSEVLLDPAYGSDAREVRGQVRKNTSGCNTNPSLCLAAIDPGDRFRFASGDGDRRRGDRWADGRPAFTGFQTILPPNSPSCTNGGNSEDPNNAVYSVMSNHPGGVQAVLADGATRFISDSIDSGDPSATPPGRNMNPSPYGIWGALGTRMCKESIGEY